MHVNMCMRTCMYIYVKMRTHVYMNVYMCTYIVNMCMLMCMCVYIRVYVCMCTCVHVCEHAHTCVRVCVWGRGAYMHLPNKVIDVCRLSSDMQSPFPRRYPAQGSQGAALHPQSLSYMWAGLGLGQQSSHLCGDQAGLTAVLGVFAHLHVIGLVLRDLLLTHHGYLALPGVAPEVSKGEICSQNLLIPIIPSAGEVAHAHILTR